LQGDSTPDALLENPKIIAKLSRPDSRFPALIYGRSVQKGS